MLLAGEQRGRDNRWYAWRRPGPRIEEQEGIIRRRPSRLRAVPALCVVAAVVAMLVGVACSRLARPGFPVEAASPSAIEQFYNPLGDLWARKQQAVSGGGPVVLTPACVIAGKVHDGNAALRAAETLRPDVIVLDISMQDMTGLEVAGHLREAGSTAALVFLTAHDDEAFERAAQSLGAAGYVLKSRLASDLLSAVQGARGPRRFEPAVH